VKKKSPSVILSDIQYKLKEAERKRKFIEDLYEKLFPELKQYWKRKKLLREIENEIGKRMEKTP